MALFVSLSGVAYAAATIGSAEVIDNSLLSIDLKDGAAVTAKDVVDDSLLGVDINEASLKGVARKVYITSAATDPSRLKNVGPIGGYTFGIKCYGDSTGTAASLWIDGPTGEWQIYASRVHNIATYEPYSTSGALSGFPMSFMGGLADKGYYSRLAGTLWLHSGNTLVQFDFHVFIEGRDLPGSCTLYGTATWAV